MDLTPSLPQARAGFDSLDESWQAIAVGFLIEKAQRTGSRRTTEVYGRTVRRFLGGIGHPANATPFDVHRFAYGLSPDGHCPSPSTVSVRLAAISGFYDFARRMELLATNPAANVRRPQVRRTPPRGLSLAEMARLLAVIANTPAGLLDRAMTVTALLTGLRRSELAALHLSEMLTGPAACYEVRTKGGGVRRRELPAPAWLAIRLASAALGTSIGPGGDYSRSPTPRTTPTCAAMARRLDSAACRPTCCATPQRSSADKRGRRSRSSRPCWGIGASPPPRSTYGGSRGSATTGGWRWPGRWD